MSRRKHIAPEQHDKREQPSIVFSFQLSLSGIIGIGVVLFCLFLWMFLLGIWAGQIILYPPQPSSAAAAPPSVKSEEKSRPAEAVNPSPESEGVLILPGERKKRIAPPEQPVPATAQ